MAAPLPAGYRLRQSTADDVERIAAFNLANLTWPDGSPDTGVGDLTRDLFDRHPSFKRDLYTLVEDGAGDIASAMCLIPQTFTYDAVPVSTGQPELVATRPGDRRRGLVRAQFELVHELAAARGMELLVIPGIPGFYRQFGYEPAIPRGGGWTVDASTAPTPGPAVRLRPTTAADVALLEVLYRQCVRRHLVATPRDATLWRYELTGHRDACSVRLDVRMVEVDGHAAGFVATLPSIGGPIRVRQLELGAGARWPDLVPGIVAALASPAGATPASTVELELGAEHPAYAFHGRPFATRKRPSAWHVRLPDEAAFFRRIAPALEIRLAESPFAAHTGDLVIGDYRTGLRLRFHRGSLAEVERIPVSTETPGDISLPGLLHLQLAFGHRTLAELESVLPDVLVHRPAVRPLVDALFPRRNSNPWALN